MGLLHMSEVLLNKLTLRSEPDPRETRPHDLSFCGFAEEEMAAAPTVAFEEDDTGGSE